MRKVLFAAALLVTLSWPSSAFAWGFAAHKMIMARAIDLLPPELKPFFERFREEIVIRATDPDVWRTVGFDEDSNHFLDYGIPEYGKFPFVELPRDYDKAVEKFGAAFVKKEGLLPWREEEMFGNLRRAFEEFKRSSPYTTSNVAVLSAVTSHYIQDAYQPLHATDNYDGAQTGNNGIHSRFERDLVERYEARLMLTPAAPKAVANPRDATFDALLDSYQLVDPILKADKAAIAGKDAYDDEYFEKFFASVKPILERRLSGAITATASVIMGAWEQAGRPTVKLEAARPVQRVRPAR